MAELSGTLLHHLCKTCHKVMLQHRPPDAYKHLSRQHQSLAFVSGNRKEKKRGKRSPLDDKREGGTEGPVEYNQLGLHT